MRKLVDTSLEDWDRQMRINITSMFLNVEGVSSVDDRRWRRHHLEHFVDLRVHRFSEFASVALSLVSDDTAFMNGTMTVVDNGSTIITWPNSQGFLMILAICQSTQPSGSDRPG